MKVKDLLPGDRFRFATSKFGTEWVCGEHDIFIQDIPSLSARRFVEFDYKGEVELIDELDHLKHLIHEVSET